ncbi:hypothetical protein AHiyo1_23010 [Arthrobacter sp. Hiyo1]|nr:hypothetical protein AHiyo1_23010 [Arthrobacter sp. Hiyo1]
MFSARFGNMEREARVEGRDVDVAGEVPVEDLVNAVLEIRHVAVEGHRHERHYLGHYLAPSVSDGFGPAGAGSNGHGPRQSRIPSRLGWVYQPDSVHEPDALDEG